MRKTSLIFSVAALLLSSAVAFAQSQPYTNTTPKNLIDNPRFDIYQRGTTAVAISSSTTATYHADRWAGYTQNSSQLLTLTNITSSLPTNVNGTNFLNAEQVGRTSGSNVNPLYLVQELATADQGLYAGQTVTLSFWGLAGAGLATGDATANTVSVYIACGTGSDEGLSTLTGTAGTVNSFTGASNPLASAVALSTSWVRYNFPAIAIPATCTEAAVIIGYTPVGTKATNEWFQVTGVQLEAAPSMTAFEQRPLVEETARVQRYAYVVNEGTITAGTAMATGAVPTSTTCLLDIPFPVTMRKAPTYTNALTATTFKLNAAAANAALSTPFSATTGANTTGNGSVTVTASGLGATAGWGCNLVSAAGSGQMLFTADF